MSIFPDWLMQVQSSGGGGGVQEPDYLIANEVVEFSILADMVGFVISAEQVETELFTFIITEPGV